jgi:hypothetical protein
LFQGKVQDVVRDDKKESKPGCYAEPWTDEDQARFSIWLDFLLPLADTPFNPVHRTGFSDGLLINSGKSIRCVRGEALNRASGEEVSFILWPLKATGRPNPYTATK